jgi:hypothetical protein
MQGKFDSQSRQGPAKVIASRQPIDLDLRVPPPAKRVFQD